MYGELIDVLQTAVNRGLKPQWTHGFKKCFTDMLFFGAEWKFNLAISMLSGSAGSLHGTIYCGLFFQKQRR